MMAAGKMTYTFQGFLQIICLHLQHIHQSNPKIPRCICQTITKFIKNTSLLTTISEHRNPEKSQASLFSDEIEIISKSHQQNSNNHMHNRGPRIMHPHADTYRNLNQSHNLGWILQRKSGYPASSSWCRKQCWKSLPQRIHEVININPSRWRKAYNSYFSVKC